MATDVQIASLALTRIGHEPVTSFSASGSKAQRWMFSNFEFIKQSLLREHGWRFAIKRAVLTRDTIHAISAITLLNPLVIQTAAVHGLTTGDVVYIDGVVGTTEINGLTFTITVIDTLKFSLSGINGTAYTAYSSAGSVYKYIAKEYQYRFQLPSDCLRLLRINASEADDYRVEQGFIYTDEGTAHIEYIFDQTDESKFDAQFTELLAARLSAEIAFYLTDNSTLTEQAWDIYNRKLSMARTMDSRQGSPRNIEADTWLNARA